MGLGHAQYLTSVQKIIDDVGWAVQGVAAPDDSSDPTIPFAYTVGMMAKYGCEFVVYGLPMRVAQILLNTLSEWAVEGRDLPAGEPLHGLVVDYPVMLLEASDVQDLTIAAAIHGGPVTAKQMVFPDQDMRWPWDDGSKVAATPLLGQPPR